MYQNKIYTKYQNLVCEIYCPYKQHVLIKIQNVVTARKKENVKIQIVVAARKKENIRKEIA